MGAAYASLLIIKVLAIFLAFGGLTVMLLAVLDAAAEMMVVRLRLQTRCERRKRFSKRLRWHPHKEDAQELAPGQRSRRRLR